MMDIYSLPDSMQRLVQGELAGGESVRWVGQPIPRKSLSWASLFPVLFAIPWTGFSLFWMAAAAGVLDGFLDGGAAKPVDPGRIFFALFGVPFVLVGLGMLSAPYWMRRRTRRAAEKTVYVITDRRAIIVNGGYFGDSGVLGLASGLIRSAGDGMQISSYSPENIGQIHRIQREDGSGDLTFGTELFTSEENGTRQIVRNGFFSIPDVRDVERILDSLAEIRREEDLDEQ